MFVYYCHKCRGVFNHEDYENYKLVCPNCQDVFLKPTLILEEEWEEKKMAERNLILDENRAPKNKVGNALKALGIVVLFGSLIIGFIGGFWDAKAGLTLMIEGGISGLFVLGFGEIINLLQDIKNKL